MGKSIRNAARSAALASALTCASAAQAAPLDYTVTLNGASESTPCGVHQPISPDAFANRVDNWQQRTHGAEFALLDYKDAMKRAKAGDLIYCDPPYRDSQSILYGAQTFSLEELFEVIARCKARGVFVVLSIDGTKRSGEHLCDLPIPKGLFANEAFVNCGRSMLKRFQMGGKTLESEVVADRLLLTY